MGLHNALRKDDSDYLKRIWNDSPNDVRVEVLGDVHKMWRFVNEGEQLRKDQFSRFMKDIWPDLSEQDMAAMVDRMRGCGQYWDDKLDEWKKYEDLIPVGWRPRTSEQYVEMMRDPRKYDYNQ